MDSTLTIILALIGSQGFFSLIILFINRRDNRKNVLGEIKNDLNALSEKVDENQAKLCRTHILRFADEIRNGIDHSEEYFRQQLSDCDYYENYCKEHPSFANGYTVVANELIHEKFEELYKKERSNTL